ncbi:MAG TPA: divergent polysaccharide deacetylase family protein [Desulfopila sp.]|nr:divergent polysaccharide deacetylase family protein [Desulfopila sp.]
MAEKKTTRRRKKVSRGKGKGWWQRIPWRGVVYVLFLFSFLVFSVGMLTYVIFFRVVVAAELEKSDGGIIFEEPNRPAVIPADLSTDTAALEPKCAIIIDDMGHHFEIGKKLINLDEKLSFSFLPRAPQTQRLEDLAFRKGHTVLLHQPMQPEDSEWDPGPGALYVDELGLQEQIFHENLSLVPHAVGVNNHMGSLYTRDKNAIDSLLQHIDRKKLFFVDSYTTSGSLGYHLARELGVKTAKRRVFLDNVLEVEAICNQLQTLTEVALREKEAIGIAHPHPETYMALKRCLRPAGTFVDFVGVEELVR